MYRGIVGCSRFIWECGGALPLAEIWSHEFVNKFVEWEAFIDPVRIECNQLKDEFLLQIFVAVFPWCKEGYPANSHVVLTVKRKMNRKWSDDARFHVPTASEISSSGSMVCNEWKQITHLPNNEMTYNYDFSISRAAVITLDSASETPSDSDNHHAISLHPIKMRRPNKLITELKLLLKGSALLLFLLSVNRSLDLKNLTVLRLLRYQPVLCNR